MTGDEFVAYRETLAVGYAQAHVDEGDWPAASAIQMAEAEIVALLPDGTESAGQYLYTAWDGDTRVGAIWFADQAPAAYVYDVRVNTDHRGKGYGSAIMIAVEAEATARGLSAMRLHVFGHNTTARSLYRKIGYAETHVTMDKPL